MTIIEEDIKMVSCICGKTDGRVRAVCPNPLSEFYNSCYITVYACICSCGLKGPTVPVDLTSKPEEQEADKRKCVELWNMMHAKIEPCLRCKKTDGKVQRMKNPYKMFDAAYFAYHCSCGEIGPRILFSTRIKSTEESVVQNNKKCIDAWNEQIRKTGFTTGQVDVVVGKNESFGIVGTGDGYGCIKTSNVTRGTLPTPDRTMTIIEEEMVKGTRVLFKYHKPDSLYFKLNEFETKGFIAFSSIREVEILVPVEPKRPYSRQFFRTDIACN